MFHTWRGSFSHVAWVTSLCSSLYGATGVTSLKFCSSFCGATGVTSLNFVLVFMERLGWPRWNFVLIFMEGLGWPRSNFFVLVYMERLGWSHPNFVIVCMERLGWHRSHFFVFLATGWHRLFPCHPQDLQTLSSKVDTLQKQIATNSVEHTLVTVRQLAGRPSPLIDNHSLLAALEQLADVARQPGHAEKKRYDAIFRQCQPLLMDGRLASVVTRLLGDTEEKQVASQIQNISKSGTAQAASTSRPPRYPYAPPGFGYPRPLLDSARDRGLSGRRFNPQRNRCFQCSNLGHFARNCPGRFS